MSLKRLEVDYIDVYLIHWPDENVPYEESFAAMDECVKSGKVRFVGRLELHRRADGSSA